MKFFRKYIDFWKKTFDYKSEAEVAEFKFGLRLLIFLIVFALIIPLVGMIVYLNFNIWDAFAPAFKTAILPLFAGLHLFPMAALCARRLRCKKKSAWWSLLILLIGIGWVWLAVLCTVGDGANYFNPMANVEVCMYGPPQYFDPAENEEPEVYGPPEMFEDEKTFKPSENRMVLLYGPPEIIEDLESFEPSENMEVAVYGPPEMMEQNNE